MRLMTVVFSSSSSWLSASRWRRSWSSAGPRSSHAQVQAGKEVRSRLQKLGVLRATGHEHFRGSLVVPVIDAAGDVGEVYGRKIRDDLRAGTPKHLYLPGPHRGVFNPAAFASDELIVAESLIDALTLWCAGFRHVTAAYGVDGWTPEHQAAVVGHGVKRVVVAFDGDDAGDRGAKALAAELGAVGAEVFRVELPRNSDVNEVAVEATNPTEVLGRYLRKAAWMGGAPQRAPRTAPAPIVRPGLDSPAHEVEPVEPIPTVVPVVEAPAAGEAEVVDPGQVVGRELVIEFADRRWRVRGLEKVTSFDVLRVNLLLLGRHQTRRLPEER